MSFLAPILKNDLAWVHDLFNEGNSWGSFYAPVDIQENKDAYQVTADLPGMKKEDIQVDFHDGVLSISASREEKSEKKEGTFHRCERRQGSFNRSFHLGTEIDPDKIEAKYSDGVLHVLVPKAESSPRKRIAVQDAKGRLGS